MTLCASLIGVTSLIFNAKGNPFGQLLMKSVQGDSGHAQVKMVADVYSHIIDDDRRMNAERLEAAFYSGRQATPEPVQPVTQESSTDDKELLLKLLQNPEMAALLKSLAKTL